MAQKYWSTADAAFGLPAAVLAGLSGLTGLASTAGRIPAAILSLIAAGCATSSSFLQCGNRAEGFRRKKNAGLVLEADSRLARAHAPRRGDVLHAALRAILDRRKLLLGGDFDGSMQLPSSTNALRAEFRVQRL